MDERAAQIIREFEGCAFKAYPDSGGVPTIGYGHTRNVTLDQEITAAQAEAFLQQDLDLAESFIDHLVKVFLNPNQRAALASFTLNEGPGHLEGSTLLAKLNQGDYAGAADEFMKWDKCRGNTIPGLLRRRRAERELFDSPLLD